MTREEIQAVNRLAAEMAGEAKRQWDSKEYNTAAKLAGYADRLYALVPEQNGPALRETDDPGLEL